jgi:hypothetical protein
MGTQTATTGNLDDAQNVMLAQCRFTAEHNAPCAELIEHFKLGNGNKQLTIPKVGQMTASDLVDGQDMINSEDIGLGTVDLTSAEVGLKVVVTDKLLRQFNEDVFKIVGRQMGDAMARKKERDIIALFSALNGGTTYGAAAVSLTLANAAGCVTRATAGKFISPVSAVHHPNAYAALSMGTMAIGATYYAGILQGLSEELLRSFFKIQINGVNFFQTGNIDVVSGTTSGYGAIFSKSAMAIIESLAPTVERERDASLRAWEVNLVSDYGVFEIDDTMGAPMYYSIGAAETT